MTLLNASGFNLRTRQPPRKTGNIAGQQFSSEELAAMLKVLEMEKKPKATEPKAAEVKAVVCTRPPDCRDVESIADPAVATFHARASRLFSGAGRWTAWSRMARTKQMARKSFPGGDFPRKQLVGIRKPSTELI